LEKDRTVKRIFHVEGENVKRKNNGYHIRVGK